MLDKEVPAKPERVNCSACGKDCTARHFMCDVSMLGECWCPKCFPKTSCGRKKHGEGCSTLVVSDQGSA